MVGLPLRSFHVATAVAAAAPIAAGAPFFCFRGTTTLCTYMAEPTPIRSWGISILHFLPCTFFSTYTVTVGTVGCPASTSRSTTTLKTLVSNVLLAVGCVQFLLPTLGGGRKPSSVRAGGTRYIYIFIYLFIFTIILYYIIPCDTSKTGMA